MNALYKSNNGRGPLCARVIADDGEFVTMERWNEKRPKRTTFQMPRWFLGSPACGWKRVKP